MPDNQKPAPVDRRKGDAVDRFGFSTSSSSTISIDSITVGKGRASRFLSQKIE